MAIVKVKKFNLISFKSELNALLKKLQEFVEVDFQTSDFELSNLISKEKEQIEDNIFKLDSVLKKIKSYEEKKSSLEMLKKGKKEFSYDELENYVKKINIMDIVADINYNFNEKEKLIKKNESLFNEINEYSKWKNLDIKSQDLKKISKIDICIGSISNKNFEKFLEDLNDNIHYELIEESKKEVNLIIFAIKSENIQEKLRSYNFSNFNLDLTETVKENILKREIKIKENKEEILKIDEKLKEYSKYIEDIKISYEYFKNQLLKENAKEKFKQTDKLNLITGYIPLYREEEFIKTIESVCGKNYHIVYEEFDQESKTVPIKIKNNKLVSPFELLVKTYSLPKYTEIDPTILIAPFFWLFFGMMVADVGYGSVLLIIGLLAKSLFNLDKSSKSMINLVLMLGVSTTAWGLLYGSLFGLTFSNPLHIYNPTENYQPIMILSLILGAAHILFALLTKAYILILKKQYLEAVYDVLFWIVTLTSTSYFIYAKMYGIIDSSILIAKYMMIISMVLIVLTGGREAPNIGGKLGLGLYALYGISGYIGDFISYVRLMALGLSGAYIAYSINLIASMLGYKLHTIVFVVLILVIGHGFNLFLSLLSAYVHTSRLIYVEYFGKFYDGGGMEFKDFKIEEKYINIKN